MSFGSLLYLVLAVSIVAQAWPVDRQLYCGQRKKFGLWDILFNRPITAEQFPYIVDITVKQSAFQKVVHCSGALITQEKVLTSRKCYGIAKNSTTAVIVRPFGYNQDYKGNEVISGENSKLAEKLSCLNSTVQNGLALITLDRPVPLSLSTNRACLNPNQPAPKNIFFADKYYTTGTKELSGGLKYAIAIRIVPCPPGTPDPYICGANIRNPRFNTLLDGTPLVKASKDGRWTVVGIAINEDGLWNNCSSPTNKGFSHFLTFNGDIERKFIRQNVNFET